MAGQYPPNDTNKNNISNVDRIVDNLFADAWHSPLALTTEFKATTNNGKGKIDGKLKTSNITEIPYQYISIEHYLSRNPSLVQIIYDNKQNFWRPYPSSQQCMCS